MSPLPTRGTPPDGGEADGPLVAALAQYADDGAQNPVLSLLSTARLLVPIVATATNPAGGDKDTDISAVLMRGHDGRLALLAFTCVDSLRRWNAQARPVPASGHDAAQAAIARYADALLVDAAGPVPFVVESAELAELAAGHLLRRTSVGYAWFAHI